MESRTHISMKRIVKEELEVEGYVVVEEPLFPPGDRLVWERYRPDLLGFRRRGSAEEVVLVECETRPSMKRLKAKRHETVSFQMRLSGDGSIRRILAVPKGRLCRVDLKRKGPWEVWVIGEARTLERTPRATPF